MISPIADWAASTGSVFGPDMFPLIRCASVALLTGVHRQWELAEAQDDLPARLAAVMDWFAC